MAHILIVDDEIGIRELLSDILTDEGYAVTTAENAASARQAVKDASFDLILLDIWMPDTDGVTLLKEFKTQKNFTSQVVMMSGHATIETAVEATKFGSLTFLEKPIALKKLLETVQHALEVQQRIVTMAKYRPVDEKPAAVAEAPVVPAELPRFEVPGTGVIIDFKESLRQVREATEKAYLTTLILHESCQITKVAQHAGLERTHLYRKLKSLQMEIPRPNSVRLKMDDPEAN